LVEHQVGAKRIRDVVWVDPEDVESVLSTYQEQNVRLPLFKEHREELGSFGAVGLERSPRGGIDQVIDYSPEGQRLVESGAYLYDSPEIVMSAPDRLGRKHLREIRSGSLVNKPARTGSQPLLLSARARGPMSNAATAYRRVLEIGGQLQEALKELSGTDAEQAKVILGIDEPLKVGLAAAQVAVQTLDPPPAAGEAEAVMLSAAAHAAADLGTKVLKLTGSASADEALGYLEAQGDAVKALSAKLIEYATAAGALPAAEADRFRAMSAGHLLGHLRAAGAVVTLSAKPAATDGAPPPAAPATQEPEPSPIADEVAAGLLGPKLTSGSR
jgi:hypothetical protein